tara:strand:- start:2506 stop:2634 length:129 start_codon:yes stop_codon:yes gene_type:complete
MSNTLKWRLKAERFEDGSLLADWPIGGRSSKAAGSGNTTPTS